ncbi:MAG: putative O-glycosylation ligase, exosortase A system-associated [Burkholderiales bacterium RIFCSPHIGHO2_12_FULL_61_11]|nr:MAG: putative O-glycosylation ligase, exosortase A system-associated [Burkholderiales bacterium RIFCSPHIGHO2_12_FULL_61_11]
MRDLVLGPIIVALAAYSLLHPWLGILGWTWVSIMNPHAYSWHLSSMPVAAAIAISILLGLLLTKDRRNFFLTRETTLLMLFMLWMCITLPFSFYFDQSFDLWNRVMKIDLMVLVAMVVLYSKKHITMLAWVLAGSIGFFGVKGGLFTLATGGRHMVWGPEGSYIGGNNELALALVMIIPLMRFLHLTTESVWIKRGLVLSMLLCAAAALGSQSRGAFLAIAAMVSVLWWRSNKKIAVAGLLVVAGVALLSFMPEQWWARMETIRTYEQDASATGRINAWWMAWNLAKANFFGGGFMIYMPDLFALYAPDPLDVHAAHSIYFMVLGEHGFVGFALFLLLWFFVWRSAGRLRIQGQALPQTQWLSHLGAMCQVSLAGYAVGGAFLSLSYYDLPYNILILVVLGCRWMDRKEWITEDAEQALKQAALDARNAKPALP